MAGERTKRMAILLVLCLCITCRADLLGDLAKPHEGRSMRATSTGKLGPNPREWQGEPDPNSNWDNSNVAPGQTKVLMDDEGPGRHHAHLDDVPRAGAAVLGQERLGQPPGDAAADLLGRQRAARRRGPGGRFLRQLLRQTQRGDQPAGDRRGRRFVQLLLADAVPQVGPHRGRQPEREADQPALLQHRLDQEGLACRGHALLLRPVPPGVSRSSRARTT